MNFVDYLLDAQSRSGSTIVAGIDPVLDAIPGCFIEKGITATGSGEDLISRAIVDFYGSALQQIGASVVAVKPNLAFFEQYGVAGIKAFESITKLARDLKLPVIADAKRGDIGSTAQAYSNAFLGRTQIGGEARAIFDVDALTVNPYLGFDTLEPFLQDCITYGKGLFVLVKTSNPGSGDLQDRKTEDSRTISVRVAGWIAKNSDKLKGSSEYSSLGAVVGATYPTELAMLRNLMPTSVLLIPGFGAQGGTVSDVTPGFHADGRGAIVNMSRGLFGGLEKHSGSREAAIGEIVRRLGEANESLKLGLPEIS